MKNKGFTAVETLIVIAIIGILISIPLIGKLECDSQAGRMGLSYEWKVLSGCMIEDKPNHWVPLTNYRVLD